MVKVGGEKSKILTFDQCNNQTLKLLKALKLFKFLM